MKRVVCFLKKILVVPEPPQIPATYEEMTLHDAIRICQGGVQVRDMRRPALRQTGVLPTEVCWYQSDHDLHEKWRRSDDGPRRTANDTVILVLGEFLRSNLRELIRVREPASRLIIVPHVGHWPGLDSFGDVALAAKSLGWNSIEICRNRLTTSDTSRSDSGQRERLLLFLPGNTPVRDLM